MISNEVVEMCQPGKTLRVFFGKDSYSNEIRHIRGIVDDDYIVYRIEAEITYYECVYIHNFQTLFDKGFLKEIENDH